MQCILTQPLLISRLFVTAPCATALCWTLSHLQDFGGYTGPVAGLVIIGIIIALLTPPVKE